MAATWEEAATPGIVEQMTKSIPLGQMGEPRQIAEAAACCSATAPRT